MVSSLSHVVTFSTHVCVCLCVCVCACVRACVLALTYWHSHNSFSHNFTHFTQHPSYAFHLSVCAGPSFIFFFVVNILSFVSVSSGEPGAVWRGQVDPGIHLHCPPQAQAQAPVTRGETQATSPAWAAGRERPLHLSTMN